MKLQQKINALMSLYSIQSLKIIQPGILAIAVDFDNDTWIVTKDGAVCIDSSDLKAMTKFAKDNGAK